MQNTMEYVVISRNGSNYYTDNKSDAMRILGIKIAEHEITPEILYGSPGHYKRIFPITRGST